VMAVVVVVIALAWTLFGRQPSDTSGASAAGVTTAAATTPAGTPGSSVTTPAGSPTASASASTTPTSTASAKVDKTVAVSVLNATGRSGLAGRVATMLVGKGWADAKLSRTVVSARPTTIYYVTTDQKAAAEALATDLGLGVVKKSSALGTSGISIVLGSDYPTTG
jgi:hypothetical protein